MSDQEDEAAAANTLLSVLAEGAANGGSNLPAAGRRPNKSYAPITDGAIIADLRMQGLTDRGLDKVRKGDLRCRPPKRYREGLLPAKALPQFRLSTVDDAARAEDLIMLWAYLTGRDATVNLQEFRFKPELAYFKDAGLMKDLKGLPADADALMNYTKQRFGTKRQPKDEKSPAAGGGQHQIKTEKEEEPAAAAVWPAAEASAAEAQPKRHAPNTTPLKTPGDFIAEFLKAQEPWGAAERDSDAARRRAAARALACAAWYGRADVIADLADAAGGANSPLRYGFTPLHWAARGAVGADRGGAVPAITALLHAGAAVDDPDAFGRTPLHYTARLGDVKAMLALLAAGADPQAAAKNGATPLHWAAEAGALDAVLLLLDRGAWEFPGAQEFGDPPPPLPPPAPCGTALHWAARAGRVEVVRHLLVIAGFNPDARDWNGSTPLHLAAAEWRQTFPGPFPPGQEDPARARARNEAAAAAFRLTMRLLLAHRSTPNPVEAVDDDRRTPLHAAAARGNLDAVTFLLYVQQSNAGGGGSGKAAKAADADGSAAAAVIKSASPIDSMGWDPLMMAVMGSDSSDAANGPETPDYAGEAAAPGPVAALLGKKEFEAQVGHRDRRRRTALHLAAVEGKTTVVRALLAAGAEADARDDVGATPLLLAARARHRGCVEALLAAGADPNAQDNLGGTPLSAAARAGDCGCVEALLAGGADVAARKAPAEGAEGAGAGRTPLHAAAEGGHPDIVRRLLAQGAEPGAACAAGRTPLHAAACCGQLEVVQVLLAEDGVDVDARDVEGATPAALVPRGGAADEVLAALEAAGATLPPPAAAAAPSPAPSGGDASKAAPDDHPVTWASRFALLEEFVKAQGRVPAPDEWHGGFPLGGWVEMQREKIRWDEMPEEELRAVGAAGAALKNWGAAAPWADWLHRVAAHVAAAGALPSPFAGFFDGSGRGEAAELGWWLRYQQARRLGGSLSAEQAAALEALPGWTWDLPPKRMLRRTLRSMAVEAFREKAGRLPAAEEGWRGVPVGRLLALQRQARVWGDEIASGKTWGAAVRREGPSWGENLAGWAAAWRARAAAAAAAGPAAPLASTSFEVGTPRLEAWMNTQRAWFAQGKLSDAEAAAVEAAAPEGFSWDPPPRAGAPPLGWHQWLDLLRSYVNAENGALPPYRAVVGGRHLGWWVSSQRRLCARGKVSPERRAALAGVPGWEEGVARLEAAHAAAAPAPPPPAPDAGPEVMELDGDDEEATEDEDGGVDAPPPAPQAAPEGPEPVTAATPGLSPALLPALQRAWAGEALTTPEVWSLLAWARAPGAVALAGAAPRAPAPGALFFFDPGCRFKQDGLAWKKEVHTNLVVDKEPRVKCYYANQVAPDEGGGGGVLLQRRCYWDKRDKAVVMVQYLPATRTAGVKREAEEAAAGPAEAAGSPLPPKRARAAAPGRLTANLAATFPPPTAEQQLQAAAAAAAAKTEPAAAEPALPPAPRWAAQPEPPAPVWKAHPEPPPPPAPLGMGPQVGSWPPPHVSPLADGPSAPPAPATSQADTLPAQAASAPPAFLPPPGTLAPDVAARLRATDPATAGKTDISRAFMALRGCGIGGPAMFWAQREAFTANTVPLEDMRFIFETVRDCVLGGRVEDAVQFVQESMESFQGAAAGAPRAAGAQPEKGASTAPDHDI